MTKMSFRMPASCPEEQYSFAADNLLDSLHDKLEVSLSFTRGIHSHLRE